MYELYPNLNPGTRYILYTEVSHLTFRKKIKLTSPYHIIWSFSNKLTQFLSSRNLEMSPVFLKLVPKHGKQGRKGPKQSTVSSKQSKEDNALDEENSVLLKQRVVISTWAT